MAVSKLGSQKFDRLLSVIPCAWESGRLTYTDI